MSSVPTSVAKKLEAVYYNIGSPGGYGGREALQRETRVSKPRVTQWLEEQRVYSLHKPARKRFPTRHYQVSEMDQQWQADLVEMIPFARDNGGHRYMLVVIDVFSRYAWAVPLKSKSARDVMEGFRSILDSPPHRRPQFLQTDQGKEFENQTVREFLRSNYQIEQFSVKSPFKAALVERLNRTLKARMWRYFTHRGTRRWIDILPQLLEAYNGSFHRILGRSPASVNRENEMEVWSHLYGGRKPPKGKSKFKVGDRVRLSKVKSIFAKGYLPSWTEEEFIVDEVDRKYSPIMYHIRDLTGERLEGKFYAHELQRISNPDNVYMVERVLRRRHRRGQEREVLVKWLGYPGSSWVKESDLINKG